MKKIVLNHSFTPSPLKKLNQDLALLFNQKDPDEARFLSLVTLRDEFIQKYLTELSGEQKQHFVEAEIKINGLLVACANELFKASLNQLSGLVRGRKAVEKYK